MRGKDKCRILKELRKKIAEENDIALDIAECTHKGECRGTCPRCEAEVRMLEAELEKRRSLHKRVAVAGIAAGMALTASGCDMIENAYDDALDGMRRLMPWKTEEPVAGMVEYRYPLEGDVPRYIEEDGLVEYCPEPTAELEEEQLVGEIMEIIPEEDEADQETTSDLRESDVQSELK